MGVRIKSNGIYRRHINPAVYHNAFVGGDIDNPSNHSAAICIVLIFSKFTFEKQRKLIYDRSVHGFSFTNNKPAAHDFVSGSASGFHTKIVRLRHMSGIGYTDSGNASRSDIFHGFMCFGQIEGYSSPLLHGAPSGVHHIDSAKTCTI